MAYDMTFKEKRLRKNKDDAKKAEALDAASESWTMLQKAFVDRLVFVIAAKTGCGINGAKAFVANLLCFAGMKPDEQDFWVAYGEVIRAEYERACLGKTRKQIAAELDAELEALS